MSGRTVIVNEQDEVIGYKQRGTLAIEDIYRVTALWLKNSRGEILLGKRALGKRNNPGAWGPAVAGTVEEGELYDDNIVKEIAEELGLSGIKLTKGPKRRVADGHNYFSQWYTATIDKPAEDFVIQKEEVEQVRWITPEKLAHELRDHPDMYLDMAWALNEL